MAARCDQCGVEEYMPYVCKFCKGKYCAAHRLPENHDCQRLGEYRERIRATGRIVAPDPATQPVQPTLTRSARAGASLDALWSKTDGKMTYVFLGLIVGVYVLQQLVARTLGLDAHNTLFALENDWYVKPWTIFTSVFAHHLFDFSHILLNGLVLFFFGTTVERLIGTRRFTYLFLGAGAVAGIAQVVLTKILFQVDTGVVGASGAIQGLMGLLVVLAPRLTVLVFFVIPAPLWALTAAYVIFDLLGAISPGSRTAHFAHLAGLALGAWYGWRLKQQGLRAQHAPPPQMRRYF